MLVEQIHGQVPEAGDESVDDAEFLHDGAGVELANVLDEVHLLLDLLVDEQEAGFVGELLGRLAEHLFELMHSSDEFASGVDQQLLGKQNLLHACLLGSVIAATPAI